MIKNPGSADDCIFCKIVRQELPCSKVYEDNRVLAFLDINPFKLGHTLVIPKKHYPTILDLPEELDGPMFRAIRLISAAVANETKADGINCLQNNFPAAGQVVFHAHWHIIPRFNEDGLLKMPLVHEQYGSPEEMHLMAQKIAHKADTLLFNG